MRRVDGVEKLLIVGVLHHPVGSAFQTCFILDQFAVVDQQSVFEQRLIVRLQLALFGAETEGRLVVEVGVARAFQQHHCFVKEEQLAFHGSPIAVEVGGFRGLLVIVLGDSCHCRTQHAPCVFEVGHLHLLQHHHALRKLYFVDTA